MLRPVRLFFAALLFTSALGCDGAAQPPPEEGVADLGMAAPDLALPPSPCAVLDLPAHPWSDGPTGLRRDELAGDFTVTDQFGSFHFQERYSGCESYVFLPDTFSVSALDRTSLWAGDVDDLVARSPKNVHYFFVSRKDSGQVEASLNLLRPQIDAVLKGLPAGSGPGQREWWRARLHLVQGSGLGIPGWVGEVLRQSPGASPLGLGFAIDRGRRLRALGNLADVNRFEQRLQDAKQWPWQNNLGFAANPPIYFNYEAKREERLAAEKGVQVITVYNHEVVGGSVEREVALPDAKTMAGFDTLEVDLDMACPSKDKLENNNCGPWDYLVHIRIQDEDGKSWHELARFISTYHRPGRYLVDASHLLPELAPGGKRRLRYEVSPPWNPQAYDTVMRLRLGRRQAGARPTRAGFLFAGGNFNAMYNMNYQALAVPIPPTAKRVELRAIITGHGGETGNCAEFCDHQHEFTIGGKVFRRLFPEVKDGEGCLAKIGEGVVPNQSGTWWFGRGGWCPGQQVDPWVVDVSAAAPPGKTATVSYRGLFAGTPPSVNRGNIVLSSWLVIWE